MATEYRGAVEYFGGRPSPAPIKGWGKMKSKFLGPPRYEQMVFSTSPVKKFCTLSGLDIVTFQVDHDAVLNRGVVGENCIYLQ